ncbi:MAG TPA: rod shape-determining protein MreC, partial [Gemmatimonadales bacterium]
ILSTEPRTSVVMTWANPDFRVSAATEDGGVLGVVAAAERQGNEEPMLELRGVPYRDTVAAGTLVLTTGLGGIYPRGVPIGRVLGVAHEQPGWERVYSVRPAANIGVVSHVLILSRKEGAAYPVTAAPTPPAAVEAAPPPADTTRPLRRRRRPRPDSTTVAPMTDSAVTP